MVFTAVDTSTTQVDGLARISINSVLFQKSLVSLLHCTFNEERKSSYSFLCAVIERSMFLFDDYLQLISNNFHEFLILPYIVLCIFQVLIFGMDHDCYATTRPKKKVSAPRQIGPPKQNFQRPPSAQVSSRGNNGLIRPPVVPSHSPLCFDIYPTRSKAPTINGTPTMPPPSPMLRFSSAAAESPVLHDYAKYSPSLSSNCSTRVPDVFPSSTIVQEFVPPPSTSFAAPSAEEEPPSEEVCPPLDLSDPLALLREEHNYSADPSKEMEAETPAERFANEMFMRKYEAMFELDAEVSEELEKAILMVKKVRKCVRRMKAERQFLAQRLAAHGDPFEEAYRKLVNKETVKKEQAVEEPATTDPVKDQLCPIKLSIKRTASGRVKAVQRIQQFTSVSEPSTSASGDSSTSEVASGSSRPETLHDPTLQHLIPPAALAQQKQLEEKTKEALASFEYRRKASSSATSFLLPQKGAGFRQPLQAPQSPVVITPMTVPEKGDEKKSALDKAIESIL